MLRDISDSQRLSDQLSICQMISQWDTELQSLLLNILSRSLMPGLGRYYLVCKTFRGTCLQIMHCIFLLLWRQLHIFISLQVFILIILIFSEIVFQLFHDISPTILCTFGVKFALFPTLQKLCFEFNFQFPQADNYKVAGRDLNLILWKHK